VISFFSHIIIIIIIIIIAAAAAAAANRVSKDIDTVTKPTTSLKQLLR
jgi:archaellum component FlaG (FlaF/FlaG flagellin family)